MQKQVIIFLFLSLICIVNGQYQSDNYKSDNYKKSSSCKRYENKVYQLKTTISGNTPYYTVIRLQPNYVFTEILSIGNGDNAAEIGFNVSISNRIGYYKCLNGDDMRLTAVGFYYKNEDKDFLAVNGAIIVKDYYLRFYDNGKTCSGQIQHVAYENGLNPFTTKAKPVFVGKVATIRCELFVFKPYFTNLVPF